MEKLATRVPSSPDQSRRWRLLCVLLTTVAYLCAAPVRAQSAETAPAEAVEAAKAVAEEQVSQWTVDGENTLAAVVTRKAGLGARLAHDHLIAAQDYELELELEPKALEQARFSLRARSESLSVDDPQLQQRWAPRMVELGLLEQVPKALSDKDRNKIRKAMLSPRQLAAEQNPEIVAEVESLSMEASERGGQAFTLRIRLALEVNGQRVVKPVAARWELAADGESERLRVEAHGSFLFSELGIEPYSAMLGAVRNQDRFFVYLHLEATRPVRPSGEGNGDR